MPKAVLRTDSAKGLGRGLGQLMNGQEVAGKAAQDGLTRPEAQTIKVEFGRGLTTLVSAQPAAKEEPKKVLIPAWFFFAADILLLAFAVAVCFDGSQPFDLGTFAFAFVSVGCAAMLGLIGVFRAAANSGS
ncbi:MAG TPA: hypothetical protein VGR78_04925 [Verrucomicrobiae bacterium]|nr:hypothetical protein [Verrucomicrobiae bacterium]